MFKYLFVSFVVKRGFHIYYQEIMANLGKRCGEKVRGRCVIWDLLQVDDDLVCAEKNKNKGLIKK